MKGKVPAYHHVTKRCDAAAVRVNKISPVDEMNLYKGTVRLFSNLPTKYYLVD